MLLLDHNTSWRKHVMEKHVLSDQTGFLSVQNLFLAGQMTCLLTNNYLQACVLDLFKTVSLVVVYVLVVYAD